MSSDSDPLCTFIIPAAGSGKRFGSPLPKQYLSLDAAPVIVHTLRRCLQMGRVREVIVAVADDQREYMARLLREYQLERVRVVIGGATRQESVFNALSDHGISDDQLVAVHDAVRPFFSESLFQNLFDAARVHGAALPLIPLADTLHRVSGGLVVETANRSEWGLAQTPQCFLSALLRSSMSQALADDFSATDEAGLVRHYGHEVCVVAGEAANFKITVAEDLVRARAMMNSGGTV